MLHPLREWSAMLASLGECFVDALAPLELLIVVTVVVVLEDVGLVVALAAHFEILQARIGPRERLRSCRYCAAITSRGLHCHCLCDFLIVAGVSSGSLELALKLLSTCLCKVALTRQSVDAVSEGANLFA